MEQKDLDQIRQVVKEEVVIAVQQETNSLNQKIVQNHQEVIKKIETVKQETGYLNQKIERNHREVIHKIDQLRTMESEDIAPLYQATNNHEKRIIRLEKAIAK